MKKLFNRYIRPTGSEGKGDENRSSPKAYHGGYDEIQWTPKKPETNGVTHTFKYTRKTYV